MLLLNDGLIVLDVDAVRRRARSTPRCVIGGVLSNNKGINRQGGGLTAPALTAKDMEDIKTAMSSRPTTSRCRSRRAATDMYMARQLQCARRGGTSRC